MSPPLRIGIAGSGFGRRVLLPIFQQIPHVEVRALSGSHAAEGPLPPACQPFADWRAMLEQAQLDALAIALPPLEQEQAALAAARRGLHLFCEKPLALRHRSAQEILQVCRAKNLMGAVDFEFRKIAAFQTLREHSPKIGPLRHLDVAWKINARRSPPPSGSWKCRAREGGGAMSSFGCHLVDLGSLWLGPLEVMDYQPRTRIRSRVNDAGVSIPMDAEDGFTLRLKNKAGVEAQIVLDTVADHETGLEVVLEGAEARLLLADRNPSDYFGGWEVRREEADGACQILWPAEENTKRDGRSTAVRQVAVDFVSAALYSRPLDGDLAAGVENTRLIEAARSLAGLPLP